MANLNIPFLLLQKEGINFQPDPETVLWFP